MDNVNLETSLSWKKVERDNSKIGFREGISDGRKENFQESFDRGYRDGFCNGFIMGKYKGKSKAADLKKNIKTEEELLKHTRKGQCSMCGDIDFIKKSISEIKLNQDKYFNILIKDLHSKYN